MKFKIGQKVKLNMKVLNCYNNDRLIETIKSYEGLDLEITGNNEGRKIKNFETSSMEYTYKLIVASNGREIIYSVYESELIPYIQQLELF